MPNVGSWEPAAGSLSQRHAELLDTAAAHLDDAFLGLAPAEQDELRPVMQLDGAIWSKFAENVGAETLVGWIKALTRAEAALSGFEAGAKSPVIALVRALKARRAYPDELTAWIKSNTGNRFLPYGSLMDRLSS